MSKRRRVSHYPTYLLKNIREFERRSLSVAAATQNVSVSDVVRGLLCARYHLDCPPESYRYEAARDTGAVTILLRLQPQLVKALDREAKRSGRPKSKIIHETITSHYKKGEAT